jgi:hypothetical protein
MIISIPHTGYYLLICFVVILITNIIMSSQSRHFYTQAITKKPFSIFDLEFPLSKQALVNLIIGINELPGNQPVIVKKALRAQLYTDFLFMPGIYLFIFLICMKLAIKIENYSGYIFAILAFLQLLAWVLDIVENIFLLGKINNPVEPSVLIFKAYQLLEITKWGSACLGAFCGIFGSLYFFIAGDYSQHSLIYLALLIAVIVIFAIVSVLIKKTHKLTS